MYMRDRSPERRSRSPTLRGRDNPGSYRGRVRSPPRARSPRRDGRGRSPLVTRRYSRSPPSVPNRARSPPPPKRGREPTPPSSYRQRTPPPTKRERYVEPDRGEYSRRGFSPSREAPARYTREANYRPRERSRTPPRPSAHASRGQSPISSRRSSPPIHPDRMAISRSPAPGHINSRPEPASEYHRRDREHSPPRRAHSPRPRSPLPGPSGWRDRSPPPREREPPRNGSTPGSWSNTQIAPSSRHTYRNGDARHPPSGSAAPRYESHPRDPAPGPPSAPISMSAHNRPSSASLLSAPTRPRGGPTFDRESSRGATYNIPSPRSSRHYNGPPPVRQPSYDAHSIPTGPRGSYNSTSSNAPPYEPPRIPFRSNNSSSTTYPRTQRFSTHLSSLPSIVPGGKLLPSGLDPAQEKRLQQLDEDKRKLLEAIEEKQRAKRQGLREWEKAERESAREGLRSELAEGHLERLSGEGGMSGSAY